MEEFNGGGRIKPLLKIFNEWKSLTGVGNLTLIEDLHECRSFTGVGNLTLIEESSMNVEA